MTRKHGRAARGKARGVDGAEILAAILEGRLTRGQFEAWHAQRRRAGPEFLITMREKPWRRPARRHKPR
ncbi:MAG: hypothetical protein NDJ72_00065 [Elusimicrobia bacterium]|nr:hypothetical protein [Elusimicrobiota bacterium]